MVRNLDLLTYARNQENLATVYGDIRDFNHIAGLLFKYLPRVVINFAAKSHVTIAFFTLLISFRTITADLPSALSRARLLK